VSEAAFLANLHTRFAADHLYTYIGDVVVSVNPYRSLDIYGADKIKEYSGRQVSVLWGR
jgi:myosin-1